MSRNNGKSGATTFAGFKNVVLTSDELDEYDKIVTRNKVTAAQSLQMLVTMGKVSLSMRDGTYNATLTVEYLGQLWGISAFSDDPVDALNLLAYKVTKYPDWVKSDTPIKRSRG